MNTREQKIRSTIFLLLSLAIFSGLGATVFSRSVVTNSGEGSTAHGAAAQAPAGQRIAGAWELTSRTVRRADGGVVDDPVLGKQPPGRLFYDASGVMALQMMRVGRNAAMTPSADARAAGNARVTLGYDAYFGRYTIDERAGTITHRVEGSLFPEDLGKDFVRQFTLDGDTLTLKFTSTTDGMEITRTLVFRRAR